MKQLEAPSDAKLVSLMKIYDLGGEVHNPWSIINCIYQKAELSPYWVNTADNQIIKDLIFKSDSELKKDL